jgi:hypothetical protein
MLYVQYVTLTNAKPIHKRQTHPLIRRIYIRIMAARFQLQSFESQGSWCQDELIGNKLAS